MAEVYYVHIKGLGKDINGLQKVVWATRSQADKLAALREDINRRNRFVEIGEFMFAPSDILFIERAERELYDAPSYFRKRANREMQELGEGERKMIGDGF